MGSLHTFLLAKKEIKMKENNKMREINNNLMLNDSPIFTIKKAGEKANIKAMTFDIEIESI